MTCNWVSFCLTSDKLGYVPQHLSEHVGRGDENICTTALGYFGALIKSGIVATARVESHITGHILFYLFKNRAGRVAFQYRTRHDIVTDGVWQGGDGGIPLFKVGRAATRRYCVVVRSCVLLRH